MHLVGYLYEDYHDGQSFEHEVHTIPLPLYILTSKNRPISPHTPQKARQGFPHLPITYTTRPSKHKPVIIILNRVVWSGMVCFGGSIECAQHDLDLCNSKRTEEDHSLATWSHPD